MIMVLLEIILITPITHLVSINSCIENKMKENSLNAHSIVDMLLVLNNIVLTTPAEQIEIVLMWYLNPQ